ncbi:MAG: hypothetical protein Q8S21_01160 [Candidatus Paracaedibacteraceae bacterium]|nr:hypothetical protein [Candidatus Paracaedibacteraceae bacterium]
MKKLLACTSFSLLLNISCIADESLEARIKAIDAQIQKEELAHPRNDEKLKKLVTEYNKLVQEQAVILEKTSSAVAIDAEHIEQNHEEAVVQRLKEHERRIDELERRLDALTGVKNTAIEALQPHASAASPQARSNPSSSPILSPTVTPSSVPVVTSKHAADNLATDTMPTSAKQVLNSPAIAQFNQAMALFKSGTKEDLKKAAEAFETITKTYPEEVYSDKAYAHAAEAYQRIGNIDEAQKCYKIAITKPLDTQNAIRARLGYGETSWLKSNKEDACSQVRVLSKEILNDDQKKRLNALKVSASCGA